LCSEHEITQSDQGEKNEKSIARKYSKSTAEILAGLQEFWISLLRNVDGIQWNYSSGGVTP
jgi:hypothetical protein